MGHKIENLFRTFSKLIGLHLLKFPYVIPCLKDQIDIEFQYCVHSTGEHINIYLIDLLTSHLYEKEKLHVYYDSEWYCNTYLFNEDGKLHGFLVNGPWVPIIKKQIQDFEKAINDEELRQIRVRARVAERESEEKLQQIEHFKSFFK